MKVRVSGFGSDILKTCDREPGIIFQIEIACGILLTKQNAEKTLHCVLLAFLFFLVVMRHTCQVTNQSSHGELSFHHNPHLLLCRSLCLSTFRVIRRGGTRLKNAAHPSYCHCCELCALKQKPGVLLDNFSFKTKKTKQTKSQLQTVLITASGPQALNALVHRKRYTQGSRQNRCVSSQNALALRARVRGTGKASTPISRPPISAVKLSGSLTLACDCSWWKATTDLRRRQKPSPSGTPVAVHPAPEKLPTQNCLRRGIQLYN